MICYHFSEVKQNNLPATTIMETATALNINLYTNDKVCLGMNIEQWKETPIYHLLGQRKKVVELIMKTGSDSEEEKQLREIQEYLNNQIKLVLGV